MSRVLFSFYDINISQGIVMFDYHYCKFTAEGCSARIFSQSIFCEEMCKSTVYRCFDWSCSLVLVLALVPVIS